MSLMSFILATLQPRVNDQANTKLWLPARLMAMKNGQGGRLLPIATANQELGPITGDAGVRMATLIAGGYASYVGARHGDDLVLADPDPAAPLPILNFPALTLDGLQNMRVTAGPPVGAASGYDISLQLTFGAYTGSVGVIDMGPLSLVGSYDVTQAMRYVIVADGQPTPPPSTWTPASVRGMGTVTLTLADCVILAAGAVQVLGTASDRVARVTVESLTLMGVDADGYADPKARPTVHVDDLTLTNDEGIDQPAWKSLIEFTLQQPDSAAALTQVVNELLASDENMGGVNDMLAQRFPNVLDDVLGPMPASGLPDDTGQRAATEFDLYLFDRIRVALNDSASGWFLPLQLASSADPVIEPWRNAGFDVPDQKIKGLTYSDITLSDVVLTGASNSVMPVTDTVLHGGLITTRLALGTLAAGPSRSVQRGDEPVQMAVPPAPPLRFTADFTITQNGRKPVNLMGSVVITIAGATVELTVTPSGQDVDDLALTLSGATVSLASATTDVTVSLDPPNSALEQLIDKLFSNGQVQQQILDVLSQSVTAQSDKVSAQLSHIARDLIIDNLGG